MRPPIEEPVTTPTDFGQTETTHPAFAQISASRVSGSASLYGSDFNHHQTIRIRIAASALVRDLSNDWLHPGKEIIEVELSEAQWATFVSSMNVGSGTPCTLRHIERRRIAELPPPKSRAEQFQGEANARMQDAMKTLAEISAMLADAKMPVGVRNDLLKRVSLAHHQISDNIGFVSEQFAEHMENVVEKAKIEVNAYATAHLTRLGLDAAHRALALPAAPQDTTAKERT